MSTLILEDFRDGYEIDDSELANLFDQDIIQLTLDELGIDDE